MKIKQNTKNYVEISLIDDKKRNLLLILPGGAYEFTSDRESWVVADTFKDEGYHQAVYYYRRTKT